ncbi:tapasin [Gastrophryne carolinensis]
MWPLDVYIGEGRSWLYTGLRVLTLTHLLYFAGEDKMDSERGLCLNISKPGSKILGRSNCTAAHTNLTIAGVSFYNVTINGTEITKYNDTNNEMFNASMKMTSLLTAVFQNYSVILNSGIYFICGRRAYAWIPTNGQGTCYIGKVMPGIKIYNDTVEAEIEATVHLRFKRSLFTISDMWWALTPEWTGWGMEIMIRLNNFSTLIDTMLNETMQAVNLGNLELRQVRKMVLQNQMALDYLLASQGGYCTFIGDDCCTWIDDDSDAVEAHVEKVRELQNRERDIGKDRWNPFQGMSGIFGSIGNWFYGILKSIVAVGLFPALDADPLKCWLVEEVGQPRTIRQTPVLVVVSGPGGLTPGPPVTPEPDTLVFYVSDPSGKLVTPEFSSCEMTVHLPQEVSLDWVRHLTREEVSPPSLGRTWYSMTAKSKTGDIAVSTVLGPAGDKKDHMTVSLVVYSSSVKVTGQLGKPLSLPCGLWRGQQSRFAVEWRHRSLGDGKVLYAYDGWRDRVEEEIPGYAMNFSDLHSKGDASLWLEKVEASHHGTYLCIAYLPYLRSQRDVQLQVTAKPEISLLPAPLFARPGEDVTLSCEVTHFHPLEISVDFLVQLPGESSSSLMPATSLSTHVCNQDGTYSLTAHQRFNASPELHGARYTCLVHHASSAKGMSRSQTLQIAGVAGPSIEDGMYLFLVALFLYGFLGFIYRKESVSSAARCSRSVPGCSHQASWLP